MSTPVTGYDLTVEAEEFDYNSMLKFCREWFAKYAFQLERGSQTGYLHWQVRGRLFTKKRLGEIVASTKELFPEGSSVRWSPTSATVHNGQNFNYVLKADTRVDGPWMDTDYEDPPPLTRQLKGFIAHEFYPWQQQVFEMSQELDDRSIKLIIDTEGNAGKSIMCEYLEYKGMAWEIPPMRTMEDIMQCVMGIKAKKCYIVDMPRAMKKDKLADFYSGLESLKNGVCYDKRYAFKKRRMDRPQVIVFTNTEPTWDFMSRDRWEVWYMKDKALSRTAIDEDLLSQQFAPETFEA
ncbi:MAG TPA: hypothetical protein EYN66_18775 [Myxococcales bacterium]|nr:hypothetical protein [Myxococcales bacterium]